MPKAVAARQEDIVGAGKTKRILAFDLIRGFFLMMIMVDHIELYPNGWDFFTGKGRLWVSAAEGFFFLSGLLIGMMYKRRLHLGMKFIFKKMWKRAAQLYVAGVGSTFLFLAWVDFTNHVPIKDTLPDPIPWGHYIVQGLLMRFTYGWADFLVRFAILMIFAPFVFYLVAKGKWWLALAGIITAWYFRGQGFSLAWQLIFNSGIIVGFYWQKLEAAYNRLRPGQRRLLNRSLLATALITFTASYASVYVLSLLNHLHDSLTPWLRHVTFTWDRLNADVWVYAQKWTMGPLRIALFFIWAPTLYMIVRRYERQIARASRGFLEMLGRNSLFVYTTHAVIVFTLKMYFIPPQTSVLENSLITTIGLIILISITMGYTRLRPHWPQLKLQLKRHLSFNPAN